MEVEKKMMEQGGERKIPVFSVLKNGSILKNIFIVNNSDSFSPERNDGDCHDVEEILVVGRHPDCNIMLTHPSISRFHLQIHSIPSRQKLSVTDLSSVHGTWVSGHKLVSGTSMEVEEGNTIRIGGSTRIYRLHWIPLSRAYDMENPFVSPVDISGVKDQEEENQVLQSDSMEATHEEEKIVPGEDVAQQLDWISDRTGSSISCLQLASPSELPVAEDSLEMRKQQLCEEALLDVVTDMAGKQQEGSFPEAIVTESTEDADTESIHREDTGESIVVQSGTRSDINGEGIGDPDLCWQPLSEIQTEVNPARDQSQNTAGPWSSMAANNSAKLSKPAEEIVSDVTEDKENMIFRGVLSGRKNSKSVKSTTDLQIQTKKNQNKSILSSLQDESEKQEPEIFTPEKENLTPNTHILKRLQEIGDIKESKSPLKVKARPSSLSIPSSNPTAASGAVMEPELFTPGKENLTPSSLMLKRLQEFSKLEGNIEPKKTTERVPFESLAKASNAAEKSRRNQRSLPSSSNLSNGKIKMKWTMVMDTSSLLDEDSMKSLQLLQGIKGTQLIIPRIVLRELNEQKRSLSLFFFRRRTDVIISSALDWIQDCTIKTRWWAHLQSSSEETGPTAPTPPASPLPMHRTDQDTDSPTSQDSVLECALLYRKNNTCGQLIILSNDEALKVKAMAEGVRCETAREFYESITDPSSDRFMWGASSARGQTWCHEEDIVLRERCNTRSLRYKQSSSSSKGLKLILLHNSQYGHNLSK